MDSHFQTFLPALVAVCYRRGKAALVIVIHATLCLCVRLLIGGVFILFSLGETIQQMYIHLR